MNRILSLIVLSSFAVALHAAPANRSLPVAYDVDVVVAGGGCGAVSAAVAAARAGAKVFLLAPRNYLGEDVAGSMQLWLEPGEVPSTELARAMFSDPADLANVGFPYTYKTDQPANKKHPDTAPPSHLCGRHEVVDAQHDSVQYDADVTITAVLTEPQFVRAAELKAFNRSRDFQVKDAQLEISADGKKWRKLGTFACENFGGKGTVTIPINERISHARMLVRRAASANRLLLGSLTFLPPEPPPGTAKSSVVRPMHVKTTLENALRTAKVEFLFGCYPSELLTDATGRPAGLVMVNRMGRQAIRAKVVIDATEQAVVARIARAKFSEFKVGPQAVRWVTIAEKAREGVQAKQMPFPVTVLDMKGQRVTKQKALWFEHALSVKLPDDGWPARAKLEQQVRELTYNPTQLYSADAPWLVPPCAIRGAQQGPSDWPGAERLPLDVCRPADLKQLWVLGGCADVPRALAGKLQRPVAIMQLGERIGTAAAKEARDLSRPADVKVHSSLLTPHSSYDGEMKEFLGGLRPVPLAPGIPESARPLPLLGHYDVVVVGGGTSGAAAGIGAARQGARTLVIEYLHGLGGVGTLGMIGKYWYGSRVGFADKVPQNPIEVRMEYYRSELRKAGADIWFGVIGCGALVEGNRVRGVVVATPYGRGAVTADAVIDGTGNADIAAAAGAETRFVEDFFALQAAHVPPREVGASYINGNIPAVDPADPLDVREAFMARTGRYFDRGQLMDSRERRRIVGDYCLDWLDQINRRTFPDSIVLGRSDYDSHGYQVHPYFMLKPTRPPDDYKHNYTSYVPYRCLLPRGLEGILVVGLGISAHRDAMPIVRMQPDLGNIGYAAGVAAAMAVRDHKTPRQVGVKALQQHLVEVGNLPEIVLRDRDSFPMPDIRIANAVRHVTEDYDDLEVLLADPPRALPKLRTAYDAAPAPQKLAYAHVLGIMGDVHGADTLLAEAKRRLQQNDLSNQKDANNMDPVTQLLWALGRTGDRRVVPVLSALAAKLAPTEYVRLRAIAVSLGAIRDPAAAPALTALLKAKAGANDTIELMTACALFRCGDSDGAARRALERFAAGTNGPFAQLAWQVMESERSKKR
ncbi:MAG: FAD-dependent oxidoreductase [Verrucomicrobia bacterium]|nr:FAD-dependent oxidoreductase [Verrucomicrobiota bacterium]